MKSHTCEFSPAHGVRLCLGPVLVVMVFALAMKAGVATGWLPSPRPWHDADRTILHHQAAASRTLRPVNIVLIGDSSCLMDVSVPLLNRELPGTTALNLGTLSYLSLDAYADLLRPFAQTNRATLQTVVLLLHPDALRRAGESEYHRAILTSLLADADFCPPNEPELLCRLGIETFRARVLTQLVPQPLTGALARHYGFSGNLWSFLAAHGGSAIDPGRYEPVAESVRDELQLAPVWQTRCASFRGAVPEGVRLLVGITPMPEDRARPSFLEERGRVLAQLGRWLRADALLDELPATLPAGAFASPAHLNQPGRRGYTFQLARALEMRLSQPAP